MHSFIWDHLVFAAPGVDHKFCQHHQPPKSTTGGGDVATTHNGPSENKEQTLDRLALAEYVNENGSYDDKLCNVFRSGISKSSRNSTYGFLATFLNCSVIVGFAEQPCSEGSKMKISHFVLVLIHAFHMYRASSATCASSYIDDTAVWSATFNHVLRLCVHSEAVHSKALRFEWFEINRLHRISAVSDHGHRSIPCKKPHKTYV